MLTRCYFFKINKPGMDIDKRSYKGRSDVTCEDSGVAPHHPNILSVHIVFAITLSLHCKIDKKTRKNKNEPLPAVAWRPATLHFDQFFTSCTFYLRNNMYC